ncbi:hypothetical protein KVT40_000772 [Elsinoe batatas]|uniref:Uncharacterized protein n=1 Tax=Elsinoe batatas TaxID=2601811 RepID=A0A8K0L9X7_9PEZI|nr:hypothetical protein KVT40_000772 [Elsinoe batatas]
MIGCLLHPNDPTCPFGPETKRLIPSFQQTRAKLDASTMSTLGHSSSSSSSTSSLLTIPLKGIKLEHLLRAASGLVAMCSPRANEGDQDAQHTLIQLWDAIAEKGEVTAEELREMGKGDEKAWGPWKVVKPQQERSSHAKMDHEEMEMEIEKMPVQKKYLAFKVETARETATQDLSAGIQNENEEISAQKRKIAIKLKTPGEPATQGRSDDLGAGMHKKSEESDVQKKKISLKLKTKGEITAQEKTMDEAEKTDRGGAKRIKLTLVPKSAGVRSEGGGQVAQDAEKDTVAGAQSGGGRPRPIWIRDGYMNPEFLTGRLAGGTGRGDDGDDDDDKKKREDRGDGKDKLGESDVEMGAEEEEEEDEGEEERVDGDHGGDGRAEEDKQDEASEAGGVALPHRPKGSGKEQ